MISVLEGGYHLQLDKQAVRNQSTKNNRVGKSQRARTSKTSRSTISIDQARSLIDRKEHEEQKCVDQLEQGKSIENSMQLQHKELTQIENDVDYSHSGLARSCLSHVLELL